LANAQKLTVLSEIRKGRQQMNTKKIVFSGMVTGVVGVGLGLVVLALAPCPYTGKPYQNLDRTYTLIGGIAGLLIGASQETIRQLKKERDYEEAIAEKFRQAKDSFLHLHSDSAHLINHVEKDRF
jgi:hypothetical protein